MSIYKPGGDIRGVYPEQINEKLFYKLGVIIGNKINKRKVVIGNDPRESSPKLKEALLEGLLSTPIEIYDVGIVTTPALFYAKKYYDSYAALMITASHNPPEYNGLKIQLGEALNEEDIIEIGNLVKENNISMDLPHKGIYKEKDEFIDIYKSYMLDLLPISVTDNFKVVIDSGNGSCSNIAPDLFRSKKYDVIELYCDHNSDFSRGPNPAEEKNLESLKEKVLENKADLGLAYDCDGDRVVFVDDRGKVIDSDQAIALFAKNMPQIKGEKVVFDVKCSSIVSDVLKSKGAIPIMERTGRLFIQESMINNNAIFAGENSGHFFFRSIGRDDGIYASLLMADLIASSKQNSSQLIKDMPNYITTQDIRIDYEDNREELLTNVEKYFKKNEICKVDGIKVFFKGIGWGLIRKSITEPCVTLRFEAINQYKLKNIISQFAQALPEIKEEILGKFDSDFKEII